MWRWQICIALVVLCQLTAPSAAQECYLGEGLVAVSVPPGKCCVINATLITPLTFDPIACRNITLVNVTFTGQEAVVNVSFRSAAAAAGAGGDPFALTIADCSLNSGAVLFIEGGAISLSAATPPCVSILIDRLVSEEGLTILSSSFVSNSSIVITSSRFTFSNTSTSESAFLRVLKIQSEENIAVAGKAIVFSNFSLGGASRLALSNSSVQVGGPATMAMKPTTVLFTGGFLIGGSSAMVISSVDYRGNGTFLHFAKGHNTSIERGSSFVAHDIFVEAPVRGFLTGLHVASSTLSVSDGSTFRLLRWTASTENGDSVVVNASHIQVRNKSSFVIKDSSLQALDGVPFIAHNTTILIIDASSFAFRVSSFLVKPGGTGPFCIAFRFSPISVIRFSGFVVTHVVSIGQLRTGADFFLGNGSSINVNTSSLWFMLNNSFSGLQEILGFLEPIRIDKRSACVFMQNSFNNAGGVSNTAAVRKTIFVSDYSWLLWRLNNVSAGGLYFCVWFGNNLFADTTSVLSFLDNNCSSSKTEDFWVSFILSPGGRLFQRCNRLNGIVSSSGFPPFAFIVQDPNTCGQGLKCNVCRLLHCFDGPKH
jgi:hypothetical protein